PKARSSTYEGAALEQSEIARPDITVPPLPMAKAGECYARAWNEPTYDTRPERRVMQTAGERIEIIPARYETVQEQVVVKEASKEFQVIPAEYETITERVMVKPAYTRQLRSPRPTTHSASRSSCARPTRPGSLATTVVSPRLTKPPES
ncbi:MAG: hypothetical protein ACREUQ_12220, partial [Burkholderiales bacterium]